MAVPGNLSVAAIAAPDQNPTSAPTYVSARVLAADVAETITVPANAGFVRLAGNVDFFVAYGGAVAVVPAADVDDGTSNELIKQSAGAVYRLVGSMASISVITHTVGGGIVTASFYSL